MNFASQEHQPRPRSLARVHGGTSSGLLGDWGLLGVFGWLWGTIGGVGVCAGCKQELDLAWMGI